MPTNVQRFAWLWIISWLMAIPEIFLLPPLEPDAIKEGVTLQAEMILAGGLLVAILVVLLPFFWLAVWRQKNWCRWLLLVLFIAPIPFLFLDPFGFRPGHLPLTVLGFGGTTVEAVGFFFIFTGDAKAWFRPKNSN